MIKKTIIDEIKRNLLGGLEIAIFMPVARTRFGDSREEAIRSFLVPVLLLPLTLLAVHLSPKAAMADQSAYMVSLLYILRTVLMWGAFFGTVYLIAREVDRKKYFYQFVIASNWLTVPASVAFLPITWMLVSGAYTWAELYPFMICMLLYTYAFTAFMSAYILRIPWELAGFIMLIAITINSYTHDFVYWVSSYI